MNSLVQASETKQSRLLTLLLTCLDTALTGSDGDGDDDDDDDDDEPAVSARLAHLR